ncbi:biotin/lipoyl-binding protein [Frankia sp. Cpl3]|nr:biotin/lipoyl-binding protein [Frankia sp. Cpl3]
MTAVGDLVARRRLLVALVGVVVIAAGITVYAVTRGGSSEAATTVTSRAMTAELGTVRQTVTMSGTIAPETQSDLTFPAPGTVTSVLVSEGDEVTVGQTLATIDSASLAADLAQARLTQANSEEKLASDRSAGASSEQLDADEAAVTSATDAVTTAEEALAGATMTSPVNGVVVGMSLTVGQQVPGSSSGGSGSGSSSGTGSGGAGTSGGAGASGGTSSGSGSSTSSSSPTGQITVISTDSWIVNGTVDSNSVNLIAQGNQATIAPGTSTSTSTFPGTGGGAGQRPAPNGAGGANGAGAAPGASGAGAGSATATGPSGSGTIYGTVSSVGLIASSSGQTAAFPVVIKVAGTPSGLHAGDTATVTVIYRQLSNVLVVPSSAISQQDGASVVRLVSGTSTTTREVTTGLASGGSTQIVSGLSEGDQVMVDVAVPSGAGGSGTGGRPGGQGYAGFGGAGGGGGGGLPGGAGGGFAGRGN